MDLDSKVQSSEIIIRDKECFRVCNGQDRYQSRFHSMFGYGWLLLSNLRRTKKSSEWAYKKNKKHVVVTERFLSDVVEEYGEHPVSSDGCIWYPHQACRSLKLNHHLHSSYEKSLIIERLQYIKDRTEILIIFHVERRNVN